MAKKKKKKNSSDLAKKKQDRLKRRKSRQEKKLKPTFLVRAPIDVPVAEEGYRIVGPSQAMMDYVEPLKLDDYESMDELNAKMQIGKNTNIRV